MRFKQSRPQLQTGKNILLALMMLASSGCQWYFQTIKPTWAIPSNQQIFSEDMELNLIFLPLTEASRQEIELENTHDLNISKITYDNTVEPKNYIIPEQAQTIGNVSITIDPKLIFLEEPNKLENLRNQIKQGQTAASGNTHPKVSNIDYQNQTRAIPPLSSQSAAQLNEPTKTFQYSQKLTQQEEQEEPPVSPNEEQELRLRVRPRPTEELPPLPEEKPAEQFQPIGYLRGYAGYFHTSNIFSTNDNRIEDGLFYTGLTLASAYFPLSATTYINGSIDGSLVYYMDQSQYNYNQLRFNLGIYQQLSRKMYAELNFSNQKLYYGKDGDFFSAGERFLNEDSIRLSLGRRDQLTDKLTLDSLYELSANFSEPVRRSRIVNALWLSLGYSINEPLEVGLNYQFNFSDFTERDREDQFHRLFGHLNYRTSDTSNIYLQGGFNLGGSTTPNVDFSGWFFSVNYGFELGRF
jgi:hypothetical protein